MSKNYLQCLEAIPVIIFHHRLVLQVGNETNKVFRIPNVSIFRVIRFLNQNIEYRFIMHMRVQNACNSFTSNNDYQKPLSNSQYHPYFDINFDQPLLSFPFAL